MSEVMGPGVSVADSFASLVGMQQSDRRLEEFNTPK